MRETVITGILIYKCRHCEELHYGTAPRKYLLLDDVIAEVISEEGETIAVPSFTYHKCFQRAEKSMGGSPSNYIGKCDLVGIEEKVNGGDNGQ